MSKRIYVVIAVALLAVFTVLGVSSEAQTMKFEHFSIDVPAGWKVDDDKENYTVTFLAPDETAALTVSIFESNETPLEEIAMMLMEELDGVNLSIEGDAYTFKFENQGIACRAAVAGSEMILFLTTIGAHEDFGNMVKSLTTEN